MKVIPVIYEDHSAANYRPLSFSQPVFENRIGMFNLRQRLEQILAGKGPCRKILLGRSYLDPLQMAPHWVVGGLDAEEALSNHEGTVLWLNGRGNWSHKDLANLISEAEAGTMAAVKDEIGTLAMVAGSSNSGQILASWRKWDGALSESGVWALADSMPISWDPELGGGTPRPISDKDFSGQNCQWIWDIVPATAAALACDVDFLALGQSIERNPFGICLNRDQDIPAWAEPSQFQNWTDTDHVAQPGQINNSAGVWVAQKVKLSSSVAIDASAGPVILDRNVTIMPHVFLEGPLYIGPGSTVKAGAAIYGESSFGIMNKIAGEIGESTFGNFTNKQHDGFIGHAVLGSWVNLGAMTTCSDLKNNYGNVRVDLGCGAIDSGRRFVGLLMGDHVKTAIGSLFNTGTCVGFASNIFTPGMPPKYVGNYRWGGQSDCPEYSLEKALETATIVMARRGCSLLEGHQALFTFLSG